MHNCKTLQDEIWEAVEADEISNDLLFQIDDCEVCRRELARAKSAMQGFEAFRAIDAPDCSSAVMSRIDNATSGMRVTWAYALGMVLLLVIGTMVGVSYLTKDAKHNTCIAKVNIHNSAVPNRVTPTPKSIDKHNVANVRQLQKQTGTSEIASVERVRHQPQAESMRKNQIRRKWNVSPAGKDETHIAAASSEPITKPVSPQEQDEQQLAIVVVGDSNNKQEQSGESLDYAYTQTNPETGDVTKYSVKRSDGSVEIYMESKPGDKNIPGEGSLDHEDDSNA